jgi:cephalosporin hydroxylase
MATELRRGALTGGALVLLFLVIGVAGFLLGRYAPASDSPGAEGRDEGRPQEEAYSESFAQHHQHLLDDPEAKEYMRKAFAGIVRRRDLNMPPRMQKYIAKMFHDLAVWPNNWFMGIRIQKNPCDLWMMHQIIYEVRPDYIIEAGTFRGGSALYFAHMLDGMGLNRSKVITIDIDDAAQEAARLPLWQRYVKFIHGSSTDPEIVARIRDEVKGKKVIVVLDSDHSRDHVFKELLSYGPLVSPGSYAVVEDTNLDAVPLLEDFDGPLAAVVAFLKTEEGSDFKQDFSREAMVLTFNPGGWLKRRTL